MVGFQFIGSFFGLAVALPFFDGSVFEFAEALKEPEAFPGMRYPLLIMQGVGSTIGFIIVPWILLKFVWKSEPVFFPVGTVHPIAILLTLLLVPVFMGTNAPFIEWNQNFTFPEALSGLEKQLKDMEDMLQKTSTYITNFDSFGQFLLGFVVIAIIPGIGEELVFRGIIQNSLNRITGNIHAGIWLAALLFSLFHLQFYGLLPRMFLGAMFGYLYYFSGSLLYPMLAHFINNGFTLVMLYLYNIGVITFDIESTESVPWMQVGISAVFTAVIFLAFKRSFSTTNE